jgi:hypothetical protein
LRSLFKGKCAYCETPNRGGSACLNRFFGG